MEIGIGVKEERRKIVTGKSNTGANKAKKVFVHPRLGEVTLSQTTRSRRLSITVNRHGKVRLSFPLVCPKKVALEFLELNADKVEKIRRRVLEKRGEQRRIIEPPYVTVRHSLEFVRGQSDRAKARVTADKMIIFMPSEQDTAADEFQQFVRKVIATTLREEGREILPPIVARLAVAHGFEYRSVTVRATTSRWGSCSSRNDISLSCYLVRLPAHLIEFIVLHELCHTRHKNHGPRFHELLDSLAGGRECEFNKELKSYHTGV